MKNFEKYMADEKRISDAIIQSLRDKKLEMAGEIATKDAEIEKLRALVKGLADALEREARLKWAMCDTQRSVAYCNEIKGFRSVYEMDSLVARAREEVRDVK